MIIIEDAGQFALSTHQSQVIAAIAAVASVSGPPESWKDGVIIR
jgi:hypothetical protein